MTDVERRIAEGVAALRARFGERMRATPSLSDAKPQGDGAANRHGMPKEPPGQNVLEKHEWPVLDLGQTPEISTEQLRQILRDRSATVFDARPAAEFAMSHIPGARNVAAKPGVSQAQLAHEIGEQGLSQSLPRCDRATVDNQIDEESGRNILLPSKPKRAKRRK